MFVDITKNKSPRVLGLLPTASDIGQSAWRDIKVYDDHAFIVSEHTNHGVQVFDLTRLRGLSADSSRIFDADARYTGMGSSHNININEDTGYAYALGSGAFFSQPLPFGIAVDGLEDPILATGAQFGRYPTEEGVTGEFFDTGSTACNGEPLPDLTFAGCDDSNDYVHDTQCVVYEGPDSEHDGKQICFSSNGIGFGEGAPNNFSIVDVSDKSNPVTLSDVPCAGSAYSHQGWLTPDQEFFLFGDEGDELTFGVGTTTRVWDVSDLENPSVANTFENTTAAIDHNLYTEGDLAYASNYEAGLPVYDASDPASGSRRSASSTCTPRATTRRSTAARGPTTRTSSRTTS